MSVIAPDAVFLESGKLETRAEYQSNHLPADIEFEKQVTGKRGPMRVTFEGNTAWVIALTEYDGTFEGDPVRFVSAQLVVLTRDSGSWLIRTIHWSSRRPEAKSHRINGGSPTDCNSSASPSRGDAQDKIVQDSRNASG